MLQPRLDVPEKHVKVPELDPTPHYNESRYTYNMHAHLHLESLEGDLSHPCPGVAEVVDAQRPVMQSGRGQGLGLGAS